MLAYLLGCPSKLKCHCDSAVEQYLYQVSGVEVARQ